MITYQVLWLIFLSQTIDAGSLPSRWILQLNESSSNSYSIFPQYLFEEGFISVSIVCYSKQPNVKLQFQWHLNQVHCMEEIYDTQRQSEKTVIKVEESLGYERNTTRKISKPPRYPDNYDIYQFQTGLTELIPCERKNVVDLLDQSSKPYKIAYIPKDKKGPTLVQEMKHGNRNNSSIRNKVTTAWEDGMYHFMLRISPQYHNISFKTNVIVEMHGRWGYLSAIDWPLLPVNGSLSLLYLVICTCWVIVWARAVQHSFKIHVIIGVISVAGALSHTLLFIEYATLNSKTSGVDFLLWFARVLSMMEMSLLYLVLMCVSVGYGITRPELGKCVRYSAISLTILYFVLLLLKVIFLDKDTRLQYTLPTFTKVIIWFQAAIGLLIPGWIFVASIITVSHLHRRRHSEKLRMFMVFMVTCVACFIAMFVVTMLNMGWMQSCRTDWKHQWLFLSFDKIIALFLLVVLMLLWRPADEANTYAFSPLVTLDDEDDDDEISEFDKLELEPF